MTKPAKAVYYKDLKIQSKNDVPTSGHTVHKVTFMDENGDEKLGYFKPLSEDYPAILAKWVVVLGALIRCTIDRSADDRLVVDDNGVILGTVSIGLKNFKPLSGQSLLRKDIPKNSKEKELVYPSVKTLIEYNMMEILVAAWRWKEDDLHSGNLSLFGWIDRDMALRNITLFMKGPRAIGEQGANKVIPSSLTSPYKITADDMEKFPNIEGRTYWPTYDIPGNNNIFRRYHSCPAFQDLSNHIEAREQFLFAVLKELLTYDPSIYREMLVEHFGDMPLDFMEADPKLQKEREKTFQVLSPSKSGEIQKQFPDIFNSEANKQSFIDHVLQVLQKEYDEFYLATVFWYTSNDPQSLDLMNYLHHTPSALGKIKEWEKAPDICDLKRMQVDLEHMEADSDKERIQEQMEKIQKQKEKIQDRKEKMQTRYEQIWRDVHLFGITNIFDELRILENELSKELNELPQVKPFSLQDSPNITESWQLLPSYEETQSTQTSNTPLSSALNKLRSFIWELYKCFETYMRCKPLVLADNQAFTEGITKIILNNENALLTDLAHSNFGAEFTEIIERLNLFYQNMNLQRHICSADKPFGSESSIMQTTRDKSHTHEDVVETWCKALFDWVDELEEDVLNQYLLSIIENYYEPFYINFVASRERGEEVKILLKSGRYTGCNKLAFILSTGGQVSTSLNTLLIKHLTPLVFDDKKHNSFDVNILSIKKAINGKNFDFDFYTAEAIKYSQNCERFSHLYSKQAVTNFHKSMYAWADSLKPSDFKEIIQAALRKYNKSYSLIFNKPRYKPTKDLIDKNYTNAKLLGLIFAEGGTESNSLNTILFKMILSAMKAHFSTARNPLPENSIVLEIKEGHLDYYLLTLADYTKIATFPKTTSAPPTPSHENEEVEDSDISLSMG